MKNLTSLIIAFAVMILSSGSLYAQCSASKAGHSSSTSYNSGMDSKSSDIVDIAASSDNFSTLVAAVKAAGLVDALKADGPLTVFAPTNTAFDKLPSKTLNDLLKPENKEKLTSILTYHVLAGSFDSGAVIEAIQKGDGKAEVKTLNGETLTVMIKGDNVVLVDSSGNSSTVTKTDLRASNGYIHVIDTVVLP